MAKGLSRAVIVGAALAVLDARGIDGVTVRAVAAQLDVKAPTLYHHVTGKQELLDEMGTEIQRRVIARLADHSVDETWDLDVIAYAEALRQEYLAHRDGARAFSGTFITDPAVLTAPEPWLQRWVNAGVRPTAAFDALEIVTAFVVGFVIEEQERAKPGSDPSRYSDQVRDARIGADAPLIRAAGHARRDPDQRFPRQLRTIVKALTEDAKPSRVADRSEQHVPPSTPPSI